MERLPNSLLPTKRRRLSSPPSSSSSVQLSAEIIEGHDDLLIEILVLLPAKSLLRFKSVSKHWDSLISDTAFQRRHLLLRRPETQHSFILGVQGRSQYFICHPTIKKLVRFSLPCTFPFADEYVKIVESCHGLLLLECAYDERGCRYYYVFNPTTKLFRNIRIGDAALAISLIFHPSESLHYRVIGIWKNRENNFNNFFLYRSETDKWTTDGALRLGIKYTDVLSCKNRAYFITNKRSSLYFGGDSLGIFPCPMRKQGKSRYIVESNGHLHCLNLSFNQNKPYFHISEMIDNKWSEGKKTVWHQIKGLLNEQKRSTRCQMEFLGMIREERMEDSTFVVHVPGQIIISRFRDEVCEVLVDYRNDYFYQGVDCSLNLRMLTPSLRVLLLFSFIKFNLGMHVLQLLNSNCFILPPSQIGFTVDFSTVFV